MLYVGIDPGKDGAIASIGPFRSVEFFDTPVVGSGKRSYDVAAMAGILKQLVASQKNQDQIEVKVALELNHARPGQGVTSMWSMGEGSGLWEGILAALSIPYEKVIPQRWHKEILSGLPKGKESSVLQAQRLYPECEDKLKTPRGRLLDGRADALCIAEWLRRTNNG